MNQNIPFLDNIVTQLNLDHLDYHHGLQQAAQKLGVKRPSYVLILGALLILVLTLAKIFINISILACSFAFPLWKTLRTLPEKYSEAHRRVLIYWLVLAVILVADKPISLLLIVLPFYPHSKLALYCALWVYDFKVSEAVYEFGLSNYYDILKMIKQLRVPQGHKIQTYHPIVQPQQTATPVFINEVTLRTAKSPMLESKALKRFDEFKQSKKYQ